MKAKIAACVLLITALLTGSAFALEPRTATVYEKIGRIEFITTETVGAEAIYFIVGLLIVLMILSYFWNKRKMKKLKDTLEAINRGLEKD